jgi:hypothetical protein
LRKKLWCGLLLISFVSSQFVWSESAVLIPNVIPKIEIVNGDKNKLTQDELMILEHLAHLKVGIFFPELSEENPKLSLDRPLSADSVFRFETRTHDFIGLLEKSKYLNISEQQYFDWWDANKQKLMNHAAIKEFSQHDLTEFVTVVWLQAVTEKLTQVEAKEKLKELEEQAKAQSRLGPFQIVLAVIGVAALYTVKKFWDTMVLSLGGDLIRAYFGSAFYPFTEYAGVRGKSRMGPISLRLSNYFGALVQKSSLENLRKRKSFLDQVLASTGGNSHLAKLDGATDSNELVDPIMFPGLTIDQYVANMKMNSQTWVSADQAFGSNITTAQYHGRNILFDAVVKRPMDFTTAMATYKGVEVTSKLSLRYNVDKMIEEGRRLEKDEEEIKKLLTALEYLGKELHLYEASNRLNIMPENQEDYQKLQSLFDDKKKALVEILPEEAARVEEIITALKERCIAADQIVGALAAQLYHDMMHPEYGRCMPENVQAAARVMLSQFGYPYFVKQFKEPIQEILHKLRHQIGEEIKSGETAKTFSPLSKLKRCFAALAGSVR